MNPLNIKKTILNISDNLSDMNDEEFSIYINPVETSNKDYILNKVIPDYCAYYIASYFYYDARLLGNDILSVLNTILLTFNGYYPKDVKMDLVEQIMIKKYKLKFLDINSVKIAIIK